MAVPLSDIGPDTGASWWLFLLYGVAAILFGLLCLVWPGGSIMALVLTFGLLSLAEGIVSLFALFRRDVTMPRWLLLLYALISIAFGVLAVMQPASMAEALLWLLALWLVIAGIARIVFAIRLRKTISDEWLLIISGVLVLILGVLLFAWPAAGMLTVILWIGAGAIVYGALQIAAAFRVRKLQRPHPAKV